MAEIITHSFISAKAQSPDVTLVSKNEWNDGHVFSGGVNGQILMYDNTQPNNMRWVDGRKHGQDNAAIVASTPTPILDLMTISTTSLSPIIGYAIIQVFSVTTVGAATSFFVLYIDGISTGRTLGVVSAGPYGVLNTFISEPAGSHTFSVGLTVAGNVNILTLNSDFTVDYSGV